MLKNLIEKGIQKGSIIKINYDYTDILNFLEEIKDINQSAEITLIHRGIPNIKSKNIFYIYPTEYPNCKFLYVKTPENEEFLYFSDEELIEPLSVSKNTYFYGIDFGDKKYCLELKCNSFNEIYINYITTLPKNCADQFCKGLSGLFKILYLILYSLEYPGRIALKDDSQIAGKNILYDRLILGKNSIYYKYGFKIEPELLEDINEAIRKGEKNKIRNIPMIAENISEFNKC